VGSPRTCSRPPTTTTTDPAAFQVVVLQCHGVAGYKAAELMTEEEWLKRQEGLERRRMRSLRDKREAEENVKAKIRKAVTAKFRGKLLADTSATEGEGGAATEPGPEQVRPSLQDSELGRQPCPAAQGCREQLMWAGSLQAVV